MFEGPVSGNLWREASVASEVALVVRRFAVQSAERGKFESHARPPATTEEDQRLMLADEARFIERLKRRDERAFNQLVELYQGRVFRLLLRMLGRRDEAEDLAQEVFVQVFKAIDQFRGDAKLGTWLYRIAVNLCKNRVKYLARRHESAQDSFDLAAERGSTEAVRVVTFAAVARPDQMVEGLQVERILQRAIAKLDPEFREVLVLRDVEDLSYAEIGEITGLPEGTVKSRIHRARGMLKVSVESALGERIE
jgi:RNA polymerase sigma-70 factor (ECF subfamily)